MERTLFAVNGEPVTVDDEDADLKRFLRSRCMSTGVGDCIVWSDGYSKTVDVRGFRVNGIALAYALAGHDVPESPHFIATCGNPSCVRGHHRVLVSELKWMRWMNNGHPAFRSRTRGAVTHAVTLDEGDAPSL